jgi:hypothetical protein
MTLQEHQAQLEKLEAQINKLVETIYAEPQLPHSFKTRVCDYLNDAAQNITTAKDLFE